MPGGEGGGRVGEFKPLLHTHLQNGSHSKALKELRGIRLSLVVQGWALIGTGYLSHAGLLQMGPTGYVALTYGHGFPLAG